jgi:hypothetical protein
MLGRMMDALSSPAKGLTWTQLAGATVFVLAVALAWRQVTFYIMREI